MSETIQPRLLNSILNDNVYHYEGCTIGRCGVDYNVLDFDPDDYQLDVHTIAESLSKQCRYLGNTNGYYSVAQHSVRGAELFLLLGDIKAAKQFLFHDAGEAIYGDFSRPIKKILESRLPEFKNIMERVDEAIMDHFGIEWPLYERVEMVDKNLALEEITTMMTHSIHDDWWSPDEAYNKFVNMYKKIEAFETYNDDNMTIQESRGMIDKRLLNGFTDEI